MKRQYVIVADYHQFYLWDPNQSPVAPTDYSDEDVARRMKTGRNVVVIQPERNTTVPVVFEVFNEAPPADFSVWDHVVEASLELPSGELEIHECTGGSVDRISLKPGSYRVRPYFGNLGELSVDGLDGNDHYAISLWPAGIAPIAVLKQFPAR